MAGALVGGAVNLSANWGSIDGFWQGVAAFGIRAGTGAATMGGNSVIAQTGHNFSGMGSVDWGQIGTSSAVGGVSGFAGSAAGYWATNSSMLVNGISSPAPRSAAVSPLSAGAGHIAGGTTAGLIEGQRLGVAFSNSLSELGQSMAFGAAIGVVSAKVQD